MIQQDAQFTYLTSPSNRTSDPKVVEPWSVSVAFATWRQNPAFVDANVAVVEKPADLLGDYHLATCTGTAASPACGIGAGSKSGQPASLSDIDGDPRPGANGTYDAGADEVRTSTTTPAGPTFLFSTAGSGTLTGVGTVRAGDVLRYDGGTNTYSRIVTADPATNPGIPTSANIDGFASVDATHFYVSFAADTTLPGVSTVQDEDVVYWDGAHWSVYFDGTAEGLTTAALDVTSISFRNGNLFFSTAGSANPPGVTGTPDNSDVYRWNGTRFARVWDASTQGVPTAAVVDGAVWDGANHAYFSFAGNTSLPGVGAVQDEDIVEYSSGTWTVWFNGTAHGLTTNGLDVDAFSLPNTAPAAQVRTPLRSPRPIIRRSPLMSRGTR